MAGFPQPVDEVAEPVAGEVTDEACGFPEPHPLHDAVQVFYLPDVGDVALAFHPQQWQLRAFSLLFSSLCLNTGFRFFQLFAGMFYMLFFQHTTRVAIQINTLSTDFDPIKITPA